MTELKKLIALALFISLLSPFFAGCGDAQKDTEEEMGGTEDSGMTKTPGKAQNIFYAIPSPIELAQIIQKAGATYNKDLLNNPQEHGKYVSNTSKALNLGVYGADLSYTSVFDNNTQESILFLAATRKLAESLGVGNAFDEKTVDRMQANTRKRDSLLNIISDSYMTTDELLKESQREGASALVIAGGFIEAIYLGTQLAKASKNPAEIVNRIAEQKGTIDNVVSLLESHAGESGISETLEDAKVLKTIFEKVQVETQSPSETKTNPTTKVTTIGGKITYTMPADALEQLTAKAAEIRNKIVSGQNQ